MVEKYCLLNVTKDFNLKNPTLQTMGNGVFRKI